MDILYMRPPNGSPALQASLVLFIKSDLSSGLAGVPVAVVICVCEVPTQNAARHTDFTDRNFSRFSLVRSEWLDSTF